MIKKIIALSIFAGLNSGTVLAATNISYPLPAGCSEFTSANVSADKKNVLATCDSGTPTPPPPPAPGTCAVLQGTTAPTGFVTVPKWTCMVGNVNASYFGYGSQTVDSTKLMSVFNLPNKPAKTYPGAYNAPVVINLPESEYLSMGFTTPARYFSAPNVPNPLYGEYQIGESSFTATVSMTISTSKGDFGQLSPSTVVPGCSYNKGAADGFMRWSNVSGCVLHDNTNYFLNVINADISTYPFKSTAKSNVCPGASCTVPLINGPGDWNGYVPQQ